MHKEDITLKRSWDLARHWDELREVADYLPTNQITATDNFTIKLLTILFNILFIFKTTFCNWRKEAPNPAFQKTTETNKKKFDNYLGIDF